RPPQPTTSSRSPETKGSPTSSSLKNQNSRPRPLPRGGRLERRTTGTGAAPNLFTGKASCHPSSTSRKEEQMIETQHLTKRYGTTFAVDGVSFDVQPGRV